FAIGNFGYWTKCIRRYVYLVAIVDWNNQNDAYSFRIIPYNHYHHTFISAQFYARGKRRVSFSSSYTTDEDVLRLFPSAKDVLVTCAQTSYPASFCTSARIRASWCGTEIASSPLAFAFISSKKDPFKIRLAS